MSASKTCPTCLKQWADTFVFCPTDGARLLALHVADTSPSLPPVPARGVDSSDTVVLPAVERRPDPGQVATAEASAARATPPQKTRGSSARKIDIEPVNASLTPTAPEVRAVAKGPAPNSRTPADLQKKRVAAELAKPVRHPASPPTSGRATLAKGEAPKKGARRKDEFSETAWFMKPDLVVDSETGRVAVDQTAYSRDEAIPDEKRRRFSLRRKDEE